MSVEDPAEASQTEESEKSEVEEFRARLSRLEDWKEHVLKSDLAEKDERISELEQTVADQQQQIRGLETQLEALIGVDDDEASTPPKRAQDLRGAMIRALQNSGSDRDGLTWWWKDVRDHLRTLDHPEFSKPVYYTAMEDAVEAEVFDETKKVVVEDDHTKTVKAVRLQADDLPGESGSKQLTTQTTATARSEPSDTVTEETANDA